ncbi:hypothetical protein O181_061562 [Austropuccinia psidii MF-1]|uniref:Uncharacterized protein n=1 Tax=Austropuccinia psidii MF-1 TaxID=1389203 RepID=A0A9Q3HZH4_9BASI|nr:hypothetical protein [Austropuccinia psidii MF-1]
MSSSDPHRSHSGSVHDLDSVSSIEYGRKRSPMSPKITLTAHIKSFMNLSGRKIDLGNVTAQTSTTWSIPNLCITEDSPNPTNMQMQLSEGPGSTLEILSKDNTKSNFPPDFLLNPGESQEPLGKSKQPSLNIPSGSQVNVGYEKQVDGGKQKRLLENVTWTCLLEGNPGLMLHQSK